MYRDCLKNTKYPIDETDNIKNPDKEFNEDLIKYFLTRGNIKANYPSLNMRISHI